MPTDREAPALLVRNLTVRLGGRDVLSDLSFTVAGGRTLAVIGPNGAGKTVLFKTLVGAVAHEGIVTWRAGTRLGYVPQKLDIERDLPVTGRDFLRAGAVVAGVPIEAVDLCLRDVDVPVALAAQPIGELSGGQFQRLLLAFALLGTPTVLLLDEPLAGIDAAAQEKLSDLIRRLQDAQGLTVLLISHDLSVVFRDADEVLCLGHGNCRLGPPREVLTPRTLRALYGAPLAFHVHGEGP